MKLNKYLLKSLLLRPMMPLQTTTCNALVAKEVKCNIRKPRALKSLLGISTESLSNKKKILKKCSQVLKPFNGQLDLDSAYDKMKRNSNQGLQMYSRGELQNLCVVSIHKVLGYYRQTRVVFACFKYFSILDSHWNELMTVERVRGLPQPA